LSSCSEQSPESAFLRVTEGSCQQTLIFPDFAGKSFFVRPLAPDRIGTRAPARKTVLNLPCARE
jgi:hypothetical protein